MTDASPLLHEPVEGHPDSRPERGLPSRTRGPAAPQGAAPGRAADHRPSRRRPPADRDRAGLTAIGALVDGLTAMLDGHGG